jgi:hypothetical protein
MTFNLKVEVTADSGTSNTHTLELGAIERSDLSAETARGRRDAADKHSPRRNKGLC